MSGQRAGRRRSLLFPHGEKKRGIPYDSWITVEPSAESDPKIEDEKFKFLAADGCNLPFRDATFDTILNIQVLEHTFEPFKMFEEGIRVLKPGGKAIFLVPQTATLHLAPYHYQNFLRYWLIEAAHRCNCEVVLLQPLGGWWSTISSRCVYFFLSAFRRGGNSTLEYKRNFLFFILLPFMILYALISIPTCLILSLGDLTEEPNNNLMIVTKK
ncbi:MAG: class I SAM-dependent methyltransferase [Bdellovibrionaceae bacterium]|nr:class I SAM-dependent methyltransferase [Pseudobdellovibrionaceae bacterium]